MRRCITTRRCIEERDFLFLFLDSWDFCLQDRLIATAYAVYVAFGRWCVVYLLVSKSPKSIIGAVAHVFNILLLFLVCCLAMFGLLRCYDFGTRYALGHHIIHEVSAVFCTNWSRMKAQNIMSEKIAATLPHCMSPRAASRSGLQKEFAILTNALMHDDARQPY